MPSPAPVADADADALELPVSSVPLDARVSETTSPDDPNFCVGHGLAKLGRQGRNFVGSVNGQRTH